MSRSHMKSVGQASTRPRGGSPACSASTCIMQGAECEPELLHCLLHTHTHTGARRQACAHTGPLLRFAGPISSGIHSKNTHTPAGCMPRDRLQAAKLREEGEGAGSSFEWGEQGGERERVPETHVHVTGWARSAVVSIYWFILHKWHKPFS